MHDHSSQPFMPRRSTRRAGFDYRPRHAVAFASGEESESTKSFPRFIGEIVVIVFLALVVSSLLRAFLVQAFWIPSSSMEDTLQIGDNVLVSRLTPGPFELERGDVIVFRDAKGWLQPVPEEHGVAKVVDEVLQFTGLRPASGEQHLVKRAIGLGGDRVECCDDGGRLRVNGESINEPYLAPGSDNTLQPFSVTVPEGHIWVMGDNRNHSADSRAHMTIPDLAFVDQNDVVGKVMWVSWPFNHWSNPTNNAPFSAVQ